MNKNVPYSRWAIKAALLILIAFVSISCQDKVTSDPVIENQGENQSEISSIEKELGVSFFKQDVTMTDASGENQVVMRVAALDESLLKEYIKSRNFSITPIYKREKKVSNVLNKQDQQANVITTQDDYTSTVVTEFVSQNLKKGVIGFGTHINLNKSYTPNGRIQYLKTQQNTSNNWPEELVVQSYAQISLTIKAKDRWWKGWYTAVGPETWFPYQLDTFYCDGPWRVRLIVDFDYVGDYYFEFHDL